MFGAADRARGVEGQHLADDEPVKEHPKGRQVLLDARGRERTGELLDVGRDHHGLDLVEGEAPVLAPFGEAAHGREVGEARVGVPDVGGEENSQKRRSACSVGEKSAGVVVRGPGAAAAEASMGSRSGNMGGECTWIVVVHKDVMLVIEREFATPVVGRGSGDSSRRDGGGGTPPIAIGSPSIRLVL